MNLADQDLKPTATIWSQLNSPALVSKLRTLDISGNVLKAIPVEVYQLVNLKTLIVSKCSVQNTYDLTALTKLSYLKLDKNDLEHDKLAPLPQSLTKFNIEANHLTHLPPSMLSAFKLITLELSSNRIVSLEGIGELVNLLDLYLDDNMITSLPEEISLLVKLKKLSLKRNKLTIVPNKPQVIPASFLINSTLDNIDLDGNPLNKADVLQLEGMDQFLERRKALKDKNMNGGALQDYSLFGLTN